MSINNTYEFVGTGGFKPVPALACSGVCAMIERFSYVRPPRCGQTQGIIVPKMNKPHQFPLPQEE